MFYTKNLFVYEFTDKKRKQVFNFEVRDFFFSQLVVNYIFIELAPRLIMSISCNVRVSVCLCVGPLFLPKSFSS